MPFKKLSPHLVAVLAFTIFISIFCLAYVLMPTTTKQPVVALPSPLTEKIENTTLISSTISESESKIKAIKTVIINNATTTETATLNTTTTTTADTIPFTFQILGTTIVSEIQPGTDVIDAMKKLQTEDKITFSGREFSNLGFFINTINGQSEDGAQGLYWFLYVNDKSSSIGASQYIIKPNDKIEWRLKKSNF